MLRKHVKGCLRLATLYTSHHGRVVGQKIWFCPVQRHGSQNLEGRLPLFTRTRFPAGTEHRVEARSLDLDVSQRQVLQELQSLMPAADSLASTEGTLMSHLLVV